MPTPRELLKTVEHLGRNAGILLMDHFRELDGYDRKGAVDLVTEADRESESFLVDAIHSRHPDHEILGEEGGAYWESDSEWRWVVDPLDGTTNFAHGMRLFSVSIAVMKGREIVAGCVHAPALDETFLAAKGLGATLNGKRIHVSGVKTLKESLTVTGFPYERAAQIKPLMGMLGEMLVASQGALRLGSAALDFAHVAAGHLDVFYEIGLNAWDMAAGMLLVTEAGGRVTGIRHGVEADPFRPEVLATNGIVHEEAREVIHRGGLLEMFGE